MQQGTKLFLLVGGVFALVGIIVVAVVAGTLLWKLSGRDAGTQRERELHQKRTAETEGKITQARRGTGDHAFYTYEYSVNGRTYTGERFSDTGGFKGRHVEEIGKRGRVCYEPANPSNASFYPDNVIPRLTNGGKRLCAEPAP